MELSQDTTADGLRGGRRIGRPRHRLVVGALALVPVGVAGRLAWRALARHQARVAAAHALEAAKSYTLKLANIDAATVDENFAELHDASTAELNETQSRAAARIRRQVVDKKVTAWGSIVEATVESATKSSARVLLVIDQTVADSDNPEPGVERNRVKVTMAKVDGRWLASDVELN